MTIWLTRIQKRIDTNVKLLAWYECIKKKVETLLGNLFCWLKSTEEVKQPKDYATKPYNKYNWVKLTGEQDEWN